MGWWMMVALALAGPVDDRDNDTWPDHLDCEPDDPTIHPGAYDLCDGVDRDCDPVPTEHTWYLDADGDGYGVPNPQYDTVDACPPVGFSPFPIDCNDFDPRIHPLTAVEYTWFPDVGPAEAHEGDRDPSFIGNSLDEDCDGVEACLPDVDDDGYGPLPLPGGEIEVRYDIDLNCCNDNALTACVSGDCNDQVPTVNPDGIEVPGNGLDDDCDLIFHCYEDRDGDGFGSARVVSDNDDDCDNASAATSSNDDDCDDDDPDVHPAQPEACDGVDNNCDGLPDDPEHPDTRSHYRDVDGDGYGVETDRVQACEPPEGYARDPGDCDDADRTTYPGADEVCDAADNDCDGEVDQPAPASAATWFLDADDDGLADESVSMLACAQPTEDGPWVNGDLGVDCDDTNPCKGRCKTTLWWTAPENTCPGQGCSTAPRPLPWLVLLLLPLIARRRP